MDPYRDEKGAPMLRALKVAEDKLAAGCEKCKNTSTRRGKYFARMRVWGTAMTSITALVVGLVAGNAGFFDKTKIAEAAFVSFDICFLCLVVSLFVTGFFWSDK